MADQRVTCKRNHRLFEITAHGLEIKCRGCREVYVIPWTEIDVKREAVKCAILPVQEVTR